MRLLLLGVLPILVPQDREKLPLTVLYVGNTDSPRGKEHVQFLERWFKEVRGDARQGFDPKSATNFDVVVLDWSQQDQSFKDLAGLPSPLGERDAWDKPTVLLGSSGLLLAEKWSLSGTFG